MFCLAIAHNYDLKKKHNAFQTSYEDNFFIQNTNQSMFNICWQHIQSMNLSQNNDNYYWRILVIAKEEERYLGNHDNYY